MSKSIENIFQYKKIINSSGTSKKNQIIMMSIIMCCLTNIHVCMRTLCAMMMMIRRQFFLSYLFWNFLWNNKNSQNRLLSINNIRKKYVISISVLKALHQYVIRMKKNVNCLRFLIGSYSQAIFWLSMNKNYVDILISLILFLTKKKTNFKSHIRYVRYVLCMYALLYMKMLKRS